MRVANQAVGILLSFVALTIISNACADDGQLRPAHDETVLRSWLQNMVWYHRYSTDEIQQVTGLSKPQIEEQLRHFKIADNNRPLLNDKRLHMLPYPGGRHPRIGFLDGAVDPQRETKLSVFCPWDDHSYVVMDVPEAIWSNLGLTYLAHTHVKTIWDATGTPLEKLEWNRRGDGDYELHRRLPNGIEFGTHALAQADHIAMEMWLTNGTSETLSDLRVQNCVMLKAADGFALQTNENKLFRNGYAIVKSEEGTRWIISAWDPVDRTWGNPPCPCLHSDPKFADCKPGETQRLRGWLSFYEGKEIDTEILRIEATGWRNDAKTP